MNNFKSFIPKADIKRRLVLVRFYIGIKGSNSFYYQINRINKKGSIDKRFKHLFAIGSDDFDTIEEFKSAITGESVRVFQTAFRSVFGLKEKLDVLNIWNEANLQAAKKQTQISNDKFNSL